MNWKSVWKQKRSRFFFRLSTFTTARNGFSLFSGCQWVCFSFFVFSSSLFAKHFQPANERSLKKSNFVFLFSNRKSPFPEFRSLIVVVAKAKSPILSFKICEGLSAKQTPESQQIQSNRQVKKSRRSGQFVKDFLATNPSFSFFYYATYHWCNQHNTYRLMMNTECKQKSLP